MPIFNEEQFARFRPRESVRYTLGQFILEPATSPIVFVLRPAGRTNPAYYNRIAKLKLETGDPSNTQAEYVRLRAEAFARYVISGWENVVDSAGRPIPYTTEAGLELIELLIANQCVDWLWDMVMFASDLDNFRKPMESAASVGKG